MKRISFSARSIPLFLLAVSFITYVPLISRLGVYWDDWPSLWFIHFYSPKVFPDVFTIDRPTLGWLFMLTTWLVGESLIVWSIFGIITRWLSSLALWWLLRLIWPERTIEATWISILFIVYPGFMQQFIPVTYSHMFILSSVFMFSLGTMILAYRNPKWFWPLILSSLITSAITMFTLEYYVGLELLRPAVLLLCDESPHQKWSDRLFTTVKRWLPYLGILILFLVYRINTETPRGEITIFEDLRADLFGTIITLIGTIFTDIYKSSILAWLQTLNINDLLVYRSSIILMISGIVIFTAAAVFTYMYYLKPRREPLAESEMVFGIRWEYQAILLGFYALLVAGWPIWATNLKIELRFPWDRFTLILMLGACILLVAVITLITRKNWQRIIILSIIVGLAAGFHFQIGLDYIRDWNYQKAFMWQFVWRAPEIKPGTVLLTSDLPFIYVTDNSLTAPFNWTYASENNTRDMPISFMNIDARLGNILPDLEHGTPVEQPYRATSFNGSTSQALLFYYSPERCLKVIDSEKDVYWPRKPGYIPYAVHLSKPGDVIIDSGTQAVPPVEYYGTEPEHDWCYYFEKAELARQKNDWDEVARYGDQALKLRNDFNSNNAFELITFIEGYAHTDRWQDALDTSIKVINYSDLIHDSICETWIDLLQYYSTDEDRGNFIAESINTLNCQIR